MDKPPVTYPLVLLMGVLVVLVILNNAAMNVGVHIFFVCEHNDFISLGYVCKNRIPGSYGNSTFNILKNYQTFFFYLKQLLLLLLLSRFSRVRLCATP